MRFEDYIFEATCDDTLNEGRDKRDAMRFYDSNMKDWLKFSKAAEVAQSKSKTPGDENAQRAKEHKDKADGHYKEMQRWGKIYADLDDDE